MTGIADRDWESMVDRIDLDVSDAELAAAEQRLQQLALEDEAPVRAEWLEATVAKVRAEAAALDAAAAAPVPVHELSLLRRLQRFAAAAAAVVGIHSFATAATVATVGVVAVTAVVLWEAGVFSNDTMPFRKAIEIQLRPDQPAGDRVTALSQVFTRVQTTIVALQRVRDNAGASERLVEGASQALRTLESQLLGTTAAEVDHTDDIFIASWAVLDDPQAPESLRLRHLQLLVAGSQSGIAATILTPAGVPEVDEARAVSLFKLLELLRR